MGHMSGDRTKERVASTAWWPNREQGFSEYIKACESCQKANRKHGKKYGLLQHIEEPKHPLETINMDWVTGLVPGGKENFNACLIIATRFSKSEENPTPPEIVGLEDSPGTVRKIIKARKIRLNGKDQRQYLVRFKNQTADKDKWLAEDAIPDESLHLRRFRASRRTEQSHQ
ncbi:hypothetical protein O181_120830 [Austropuccinia psidii MF-1]|uniref:Integrase zinc-binding domain-containing protein n=1 Tax=Austropuccinia psidii MF-1 TaxID=1389203 RepID=A0A9Q3KGH0_9BASI|nr:hypothetical protein [Austropuccinia psidii MF-1]